MTEIYRLKIRLGDSYKEVGRMVIENRETGFCTLEMLPRTIIFIERKKEGERWNPDKAEPLQTDANVSDGEAFQGAES